MHCELSALFREYFSKNRGTGDATPDYGVEVSNATEDPCSIEVTLTFKAGEHYCCGEPGCHFGPNWDRLRKVAATHGIELGSPLTIKLNCVVEASSHFDVNRAFGLPTENKPAGYTQIFSETKPAGDIGQATRFSF